MKFATLVSGLFILFHTSVFAQPVEAQELLESMWVKLTEPIKIYRAADAAFHAGYPMGQNLCIGGVSPDGIDANNLAHRTFKKNYVVARHRKRGICLFQVTYAYTNHARTPDDGKLREIKSDLNWLTVGQEHILPKPGVKKYPPLPVSLVYT